MIGNVEVDQCPECMGIFLDRGELQALRGVEPSSYTHDKKEREEHLLLYTPHGLTGHLRPSEEEHRQEKKQPKESPSSSDSDRL